MPKGLVDNEQSYLADRLGFDMEEAVMGANDDVGSLCDRFLFLIPAVAIMSAQVQGSAPLHLAAALFDRMLDLQRVKGGLGVAAHQLIWVMGHGIGGGTALPEHGAQPERSEGGNLFGAKIMTRDCVNNLTPPKHARDNKIGDRGAGAGRLSETNIDRQAEERREGGPCHDVEVQRIGVCVGIFCGFLRRLDGNPVIGDRRHEVCYGIGEAGARFLGREDRCRIGRRRRRDPGCAGDQRHNGVGPLGTEEIVGIARAFRHRKTALHGKRDLVCDLDTRIAVAVGLRIVIGDKDEIGIGEAGSQNLRDG